MPLLFTRWEKHIYPCSHITSRSLSHWISCLDCELNRDKACMKKNTQHGCVPSWNQCWLGTVYEDCDDDFCWPWHTGCDDISFNMQCTFMIHVSSVVGGLKTYTRCSVARYGSRECQAKHLSTHKIACSQFAICK